MNINVLLFAFMLVPSAALLLDETYHHQVNWILVVVWLVCAFVCIVSALAAMGMEYAHLEKMNEGDANGD